MIIGGNGDTIYKRLMTAIGREDLVNNIYEKGEPTFLLIIYIIDNIILFFLTFKCFYIKTGPEYETNAHRVKHQQLIDDAISKFIICIKDE